MAKAAEILGVEHTWLGFVDSGLPKGDPPPPLPEGCFALVPLERPTEALVRVVREFRPHVMITYDENGGYPHPDHIRCHEVSVAAYEAAGDYMPLPGRGRAVDGVQALLRPRFPAGRGCSCCRTNSPSTARKARSGNGWSTGIPKHDPFAAPGDHARRVLGVFQPA